MLPNHPLFSDASAFHDPHHQWERLSSQIREEDRDTLKASFRLALRAQASQVKRVASNSSLTPSVVHSVRIGCILAYEWGLRDREPLETALLHDVLEKCPPELQSEAAAEIERNADAQVEQAVWWLTRPFLPEAVPADTKGRRDAEFFRAIRKAPHWVRLVKCADRLDNLREALMRSDRIAWSQYSIETMGWHLYLARETAAIAEASLFKILVEGERQLNGAAPIWVDGHLVEPAAARTVPEHIARRYEFVGIARRGAKLIIGALRTPGTALLADIRSAVNACGHNFQTVEPVEISRRALDDALAAQYAAAAPPA